MELPARSKYATAYMITGSIIVRLESITPSFLANIIEMARTSSETVTTAIEAKNRCPRKAE